MNNLTATLLLTHPAEEDAFWVLVCMIEVCCLAFRVPHLSVADVARRAFVENPSLRLLYFSSSSLPSGSARTSGHHTTTLA